MKSEIQLNSRYGEDNRLLRVGNEDSLKYELKSSTGTYRAGIVEGSSDEYSFIDPSGGPLITIGSEIDGHKVRAIYKGGIIEFES